MGDLITVGDQSVLGDLKQLAKAIQDLGWTPPDAEAPIVLGYQKIDNAVTLDMEILKPANESQVYLHIVSPVKDNHEGNALFEVRGTYYQDANSSPNYMHADALIWQASVDFENLYFQGDLGFQGHVTTGSIVPAGYDGIYVTSAGSVALRLKFTSAESYIRAMVSMTTMGSSYEYSKDDFVVTLSSAYAL